MKSVEGPDVCLFLGMDPEIRRLVDGLRAEGRSSGTLVRVSLWLDWGLIAIEHEAASHMARRVAEGALREDQVRAMEAMKVEFRSAMVTVTAASHSIDAFYSAIKDYVPLSEEIRGAWVTNGTRRSACIYETVKHGFDVSDEGAALSGELGWLFRVRDEAVHFREDYQDPVPHPLIPANAAPEDVTFSAESARRAVDVLVHLLDVCTNRPRPGPQFHDLSERAGEMRAFARAIVEARINPPPQKSLD